MAAFWSVFMLRSDFGVVIPSFGRGITVVRVTPQTDDIETVGSGVENRL